MPNEPIFRTPLYEPLHSEEYYVAEAKLAQAQEDLRTKEAQIKTKEQRMALLKKSIAEKKHKEELSGKHAQTTDSLEEKRSALHAQMTAEAKAKTQWPESEKAITEKELEDEALSYPHPDTEKTQRKVKTPLEKKEVSFDSETTILKHLEKLPEFQALTEGQKLLVMQGVQDSAYTHVKESAKKEFTTAMKEKGLLGKIKAQVSGAKYTYEKNKLHAVIEGGDAFLNEKGTELSKLFAKSGLEGYRNGSNIFINFAGTFGENAPHGPINEYNEAATALARIPASWSTAEARSSEKKAYQKALEKFGKVEKTMLLVFRDRAGIEQKETAQGIASLDAGKARLEMQFMRYLLSNPKSAKRLEAISSQSAVMRGVKDMFTADKLKFMAGGATLRAGLGIGLTGLGLAGATFIGAPVIGRYLGKLRGKLKAQEMIRSEAMEARGGEKKRTSTTQALMSQVENKTVQIAKLSEKLKALKDSATPEEIAKAVNQLEMHLSFIEKKLEAGQVNFGAEKDRFTKEYDLIMAVHEANITLETIKQLPLGTEIYTSALGEAGNIRREALLKKVQGSEQAKITSAREVLTKAEVKKSMWFGAIFGTLGASIAHFGNELGWFDGIKNAEHEIVKFIESGSKKSQEFLAEITQHTTPQNSAPAHPQTKLADTTDYIQKQIDTLTPKKIVVPKVETPTPSLGVAPKINLENSIAHISVGKGEGAGQTLLNFRNSEAFGKLPVEQQNFFKGNIWKVTEALKEFNAKTGTSARIDMGSEFGVTKEGIIYLKDGHGGQIHALGHFENGKFIEGDPKLHYIEKIHTPKIETPKEDIIDTGPHDADTLQAVEPHVYEVRHDGTSDLIDSLGKPKIETGISDTLDTPAPAQTPESLVQDPSAYAEILTSAKIQGDTDYTYYLNAYFGEHSALGLLTKPFTESKEWLAIHNVPAQSFLQYKPSQLQSGYGSLLMKMKNLAESDTVGPGDMSIEEYLKYLYQLQAKTELLEKATH
jgi:hypothetical protein